MRKSGHQKFDLRNLGIMKGGSMITVGRIGIRLYKTAGDRRRAVTQMVRHGKYDYFTGYRDANSTHPAGLSFGNKTWMKGTTLTKDVFYKGKHIIH